MCWHLFTEFIRDLGEGNIWRVAMAVLATLGRSAITGRDERTVHLKLSADNRPIIWKDSIRSTGDSSTILKSDPTMRDANAIDYNNTYYSALCL